MIYCYETFTSSFSKIRRLAKLVQNEIRRKVVSFVSFSHDGVARRGATGLLSSSRPVWSFCYFVWKRNYSTTRDNAGKWGNGLFLCCCRNDSGSWWNSLYSRGVGLQLVLSIKVRDKIIIYNVWKCNNIWTESRCNVTFYVVIFRNGKWFNTT